MSGPRKYQPPHTRIRVKNCSHENLQRPTSASSSTYNLNSTTSDKAQDETTKSTRRSEAYTDTAYGRLQDDVRNQAGPSIRHSQFNKSPNSSISSNQTGYNPPPSRRNWSKNSLDKSALSSPADDIKPMRSGAGGKVDIGEMELLQSVSRSGGDGKDGDALKDWDMQEKYRVFINEKIGRHYSSFSTPRHTAPAVTAKDELESLGSIVLLFRKLREGVVASSRIDAFAVEVFESSAQFSILANNKPQLISSLSGLVPGLYQALDSHRDGKGKSNIRIATKDEDVAADRVRNMNNEGRSSEDRRKEFARLFLLYQLINLGEKAFWSSYLALTHPRKKNLRRPLDETGLENGSTHPCQNGTSATSSGPPSMSPKPFINPCDLSLVISIARSVSPHALDSVKYFSLRKGATTYEKAILSWEEDKIRERAWDILRKAYITTRHEWAGSFLGIIEEDVGDWVRGKGMKVEEGIIKLR
ncbi:uncharacterized protein IL334_002756 [Kwoniella shivajii]|uniref:Uncharacterized protein n=1 Tax=Kwoniella shivajii TaxID=564305 RepID=A0ABZ1CWS9_9TREE|nr:hypothetical protein IL334_002756 [Kwoniella shivajii]